MLCYVDNMNNQYITVSAAARLLDVSRQYISAQIKKGKIKGFYRIGHNVMIQLSWVEHIAALRSGKCFSRKREAGDSA